MGGGGCSVKWGRKEGGLGVRGNGGAHSIQPLGPRGRWAPPWKGQMRGGGGDVTPTAAPTDKVAQGCVCTGRLETELCPSGQLTLFLLGLNDSCRALDIFNPVFMDEIL